TNTTTSSTLTPFMLKSPLPPISTLFPYTTLFRSVASPTGRSLEREGRIEGYLGQGCERGILCYVCSLAAVISYLSEAGPQHFYRSEEHTSELQSRVDLVCRLLLEKKNLI